MNQAVTRAAYDGLQSEIRSIRKTSSWSGSNKWNGNWSRSGGRLGVKSVSWSWGKRGREYKSVSRSKNI